MVVAPFADAHTSVSVLAEPALPRDVTAVEGIAHSAAEFFLCGFYERTVYLLCGPSVLCCRQFSVVLRRQGVYKFHR